MKAVLAERHHKRVADLDVSDLVVASVVSKLAASTATYPHEVVRARMHVKGLGPFKGTFDVVRDLWAEGGAKSFYRGCGTNLVRFAVQTFILRRLFGRLSSRGLLLCLVVCERSGLNGRMMVVLRRCEQRPPRRSS